MGCQHEWVVRENRGTRMEYPRGQDFHGIEVSYSYRRTYCSKCGIQDPDEAHKERMDAEDQRRSDRERDRLWRHY